MTCRHHRRRTFYVILVLDIWICSSGAAVVTDCPGEVDLQKHVNMTCSFGNEPVQDSFRIRLIQRINSSDERKDVLTCQWQRTNHICIPLSGYGYYAPITNNVVLFIKNITSENLGSYICQRIQSEEGATPCEIKLRDPFDIPTIEISGSQTTVPKKEAEDSQNVGLIIGVCVGLLIIIIIIATLAIVYYIKIKRPRMAREQEMSPVKSETKTMLALRETEAKA